jgi:hypothetical protein
VEATVGEFYGHPIAMFGVNASDGVRLFSVVEQVDPATGESKGVSVTLNNHDNRNAAVLYSGETGAGMSLGVGFNNPGLSADENGIMLNGKYVYWQDNGGGTYSLVGYDYGVPRITNLKATRCDADRNPSLNGTYAQLEFDWACDLDVTNINVKRTWGESESSSTDYAVSNRKSGHFSARMGGGSLSSDTAFTYTVSITVNGWTSSLSVVVPATT